jgi:SAM-dependent methyltransferase
MRTSTSNLKLFYDQYIGQIVIKILEIKIKQYWPELKNKRVLGIGFANPLLDRICKDTERVFSLMPADQGVVKWGDNNVNASLLSDECSLPFPDSFFDKIIIFHALEGCRDEKEFLRESWRVLEDGGTIIIIVPKPRTPWSFFKTSPFVSGKTCSTKRLKKILNDILFLPLQSDSILFTPPLKNNYILDFFLKYENIGRLFFPGLCGLNIIEAQKHIYFLSKNTSNVNFFKKYIFFPKRNKGIES